MVAQLSLSTCIADFPGIGHRVQSVHDDITLAVGQL